MAHKQVNLILITKQVKVVIDRSGHPSYMAFYKDSNFTCLFLFLFTLKALSKDSLHLILMAAKFHFYSGGDWPHNKCGGNG